MVMHSLEMPDDDESDAGKTSSEVPHLRLKFRPMVSGDQAPARAPWVPISAARLDVLTNRKRSAPQTGSSIQMTNARADKPSRIIRADGSEAHHRPGAPAEEAPTVVQSQLSNASLWDPPPLEAGTRATLVIQVAGAEPGDIVASAHSALTMGLGLQLSAICGSEKVEAMLFNSGDEAVDVPAGQLRVVVTKMLWPQLKMDDVGTGGDSGLACVDDFRASMGVTTHWQTPVLPLPGELDMLTSAGFSFVRTDMLWSQVERTPGVCECRTGRLGL